MAIKIPGTDDLDELRLVDDDPPAGPAVFGERELPGSYRGPERRRRERRQAADRRDAVRFEPDKPERRSGTDRRKGSWKTDSDL